MEYTAEDGARPPVDAVNVIDGMTSPTDASVLDGSQLDGMVDATIDATVDAGIIAAGSALDFDGHNDRVGIARPIADDFTIEAWIKTTDSQRLTVLPRARSGLR